MSAKGLRISTDLSLPVDTVTATLVAYGGKGMGKTNLGSVLVEELTRNGLRWAWLDPLGVSWGLRHSADGAASGIECLILGGPKGDVPIEPNGGAAVADVVVEEPHNVLIDFSRKLSGEMWSVGERVRFVTAYALRLFQRQGEIVDGRRREPLFQVLDEAARYIPQVIPSGAQDLAKCVGAWEQLVEEGRNVGLGVGLLTQRSARMNKSVSELADVMFAFRTVGPNSLGAVMDWLGEHVEKARLKDLAEQVRALERGHALVVSPGWLKFEGVVRVRMRETFDSSATPKAGERPRTARGIGARPDIEAIRKRMASTIERAKAEDPRELRKRVADLERALNQERNAKDNLKAATARIAATKEKRVEVPVLKDARVKRLEAAAAHLERLFTTHLQEVHDRTVAAGKSATEAAREVTRLVRAAMAVQRSRQAGINQQASGAAPFRPAPVGRGIAALIPDPPVRPRLMRGNGAEPAGDLGKGERAVLIAVAQHPAGVARDQLTVLTGYKRSTRDAYIARLRAAGYVDETGGSILATDEGLHALGPDFEPLPTGDALREHWLGRLPDGERKVFEAVAGAYPEAVERAALDDAVGYKRSTRDAYVQRLSARRLVTLAGRGAVRASDHLFGG